MRWEQIGAVALATNDTFAVQTDAMVLARFAMPKGGERVCDLGTGCGTMPAVWLNEFGFYGDIVGVERNAEAVALCRQTIERGRFSRRFTVLEKDWNTLGDRAFDRVVCNPPYFAQNTGAVNRDPAAREARHEKEGSTMSVIVRVANRLLGNGGRFCFCFKPERLCEIFTLLQENGLEPKRLQAVQHKADLPPFILLCEARKNGRPGLSMQPSLLLNE